MSYKILANDGISKSGKHRLEREGFEVSTEHVPQANLIEAIQKEQYVGLLVRSATTVRRDLIDACPSLRFVGRGGVGMDNIDVEYAELKGLDVFNTPGASSQSVAELVMAHLFGLARGLYDANRTMPESGASEFKSLKKRYSQGTELRGKKIGVIGFGKIGRSVAEYALGCGMDVYAYDIHHTSDPVSVKVGHNVIDIHVDYLDIDKMLTTCDCLSIHVPLPKNGQPVLSTEEFEMMKDGMMLVNASRGGVVDEQALLNALDSGKVRCAGIDVFDNEPTPWEKVLKHPKVSLSPHIGAATGEAQDRIGLELADEILKVMDDKA